MFRTKIMFGAFWSFLSTTYWIKDSICDILVVIMIKAFKLLKVRFRSLKTMENVWCI